MKVLDAVRRVIKHLLILLSVAMCVIVFWQVVSRFIVRDPSRWSEEVARYLMIWMTFLASSVGISRRTHLGLTIVVDSIKNPIASLIVRIVQDLCIIAFALVLCFYGLQYAVEGARQTGMSIPIRMSVVYGVIPLSGLFMVINALENIASAIRESKGTIARKESNE